MFSAAIKILLGVAILYLVVLGLLWAFQGRLIHLPHVPGRTLMATPADVDLAYDDVEIATSDGETLHGWFVPKPQPRAVLLFFHGNAGNISHRLDSLRLFHDLALSVLIVDYRGYGRSTGNPGEKGLHLDAEAALAYLREACGVDGERIVVFGRSLGAAVAARLAAEHRVGALILESAFTSVAAMAAEHYPIFPTDALLRHRYDTLAALRQVAAPVLIIHSRHDELIDFSHGQKLYEAASEPRRFLAIHGDHNSGFLQSRESYLAGLRAFLNEEARIPAARRPISPSSGPARL